MHSLFLSVLYHYKSTDYIEPSHLSPPVSSLPPSQYNPPHTHTQSTVHSFRQCVWNMIPVVLITGAFTLGIGLCITQYSD